MLETLIFSVLGSFIYDNAEFFKTANKQVNQGYNWEWNYKERNVDVPAIPFKHEDGSEKVIWVLEK
tara:strand:- start:671 stop:868 length:198 start_codon:yes stop_codon:yes gene_type:complete